MQEELKLSKNTAKLHQMFGKKLYGNKFSFISEICQNAVDSHRMKGEKDPVIVGIRHKKDVHGANLNNLQFYVKDIGLSFRDKEDFIEKVCTILESGKTEEKTADENCAMGMHGIGSISVSAYQPKWKYTIVSTQGQMFTCTLQEVEGKGLTFEMSDYKPTNDYPSVLFEVDLQSTYSALNEFVANLKDRLCYFKDIQFEFDPEVIRQNKELLTLNTDFQIFQAPDFQVSTLSKSNEMHINLDQYSYPIKWNLLGINPIKLNIGLKFSMVDGLTPDITRENLIHTDDYKNIIMKKIVSTSDWIMDKYNERTPDEFENLKTCIQNINSPKFILINGNQYHIKEIESFTKKKPKEAKFKGVSDKILNKFIAHTTAGMDLYTYAYDINQNGSKVQKRHSWCKFSGKNFFLYDQNKKIPQATLSFLKDKYKGSQLFYKRKITMNKGDFCYQKLLGLSSLASMKTEYKLTGNNTWRKSIDEFNILQEAFEKENLVKIEDLVVPAEYFRPRKAVVKKQKVSIDDLSGEVSIKFGVPMVNRSSEFDCRFDNKIVKVRDLATMKTLQVYGLESERTQLNWLYKLSHYGTKNDINTCIITETQQVHIKKLNLSNFMDIKDFFAGKHPTFRRIVTSYLVSVELEGKYPIIFRHKDIIEKHICKEFGEDLKKLELYAKEFSTLEFGKAGYPKDKFMKSILDVAKQGNLYDPVMYQLLEDVKSDIENFDFIEFFADIIKYTYHVDKTQPVRALKAMLDVAQNRKTTKQWNKYTLL